MTDGENTQDEIIRLTARVAELEAALTESRAYASALIEEMKARTAKLERERALTQAQVDRALVNYVKLDTNFTALSEAAQSLGAMPEGYCFCSENRAGDDSKTHEPECRDLRAALSTPTEEPKT